MLLLSQQPPTSQSDHVDNNTTTNSPLPPFTHWATGGTGSGAETCEGRSRKHDQPTKSRAANKWPPQRRPQKKAAAAAQVMTAPDRKAAGQRIKLSRELMVRLSEALAARAAAAHSCSSGAFQVQPPLTTSSQVSGKRPPTAITTSTTTTTSNTTTEATAEQQPAFGNQPQPEEEPQRTLPEDSVGSHLDQQAAAGRTPDKQVADQVSTLAAESSPHQQDLTGSKKQQQQPEHHDDHDQQASPGRPPPGKRRSRRRRQRTCRLTSSAGRQPIPVIRSSHLRGELVNGGGDGDRLRSGGTKTLIRRPRRCPNEPATRCDSGASGQCAAWRPRAALLWAALLLALALSLAGGSPQVATPTPGTGLTGADVELSRAVLATMSTQAPPEQQAGGVAGGEPSGGGGGGPIVPAAATPIMDRLLDFGRIFVMGAIIVGDICGNSLVILSVCRHSKLRVTTNWFVVSLACADILVALFAMTFNASVIISGRWLFSQWVCDFWNSCDVLASTASILHLCCISIDRYIAITRPLDYPMKITTKRVMYALCGVWISSALLSYIPIFTGVYTTAEHINWLQENPDQCDFVVNRVYAIVSSSISFWIPSSIMVFTYYRIYKEATRQEKFIYKAQSMMPAPVLKPPATNHAHQGGKQRRSKSVAVATLGGGGGGGNTGGMKQLARQQYELAARPAARPDVPAVTLSGPGFGESGERASSLLALESAGTNIAGSGAAEPAERDPLALDLNNNPNGASPAAGATPSCKPAVSFQPATPDDGEPDDEADSNSGQSTPTKRSISKMKREHKAAKTLGIIMGVFILCWLPFFSWYTPQHICGHACDGIVPRSAVTILFWIGYFNSTLNPIIYAYFNHEFRDAFKKTLQWIFCCCKDLKCLRVNRPNDNQHYNCTYRSTQEIGLVSNS